MRLFVIDFCLCVLAALFPSNQSHNILLLNAGHETHCPTSITALFVHTCRSNPNAGPMSHLQRHSDICTVQQPFVDYL